MKEYLFAADLETLHKSRQERRNAWSNYFDFEVGSIIACPQNEGEHGALYQSNSVRETKVSACITKRSVRVTEIMRLKELMKEGRLNE